MIRVSLVTAIAIVLMANRNSCPVFAQSPAVESVPAEANESTKLAATEVSAKSISADDAKAVARNAYEIVRSGDILNKDFEDVVKQLEGFQGSSHLSGQQKQIGASLLKAMKSLSKLRLGNTDSADSNKLLWSTKENGGEEIIEFRSGLIDRKNEVKDAAGKIAVEYLAIGDLADKLQMTTQDFQKAMGEKEALILSIKALNSAVKTELDEAEKKDINLILDKVYPPAKVANATSSTSSTGKDGEKTIDELIEQYFKENVGDKDAEKYTAWAKRVFDRGVTSKQLLEAAFAVNPNGNVFDSGEHLTRILAIVDAVPAIHHKQAKDWTPDPQVMRVRRVAARLHFWSEYANRVAEAVLTPSATESKVALLPTKEDGDQGKQAASIYQRIRVSLWPLVGGAEGEIVPGNQVVGSGKTYRTRSVSQQGSIDGKGAEAVARNYTLPNAMSGKWVRFAVQPAPKSAEKVEASAPKTRVVVLTTFEGQPLENGDSHKWKIFEFYFVDGTWKLTEGRTLELGKSYRLSAGGVFIAPTPKDNGNEDANTFSVALPPRSVNNWLPDPTPTPPPAPLNLSVTIKGLTTTKLENISGETWKVIRFVWRESSWVAHEGENEAKFYLSPASEEQPEPATKAESDQ